ncbi:hypothetical protein pb186bvf_016699 [Paramecium bursaria]
MKEFVYTYYNKQNFLNKYFLEMGIKKSKLYKIKNLIPLNYKQAFLFSDNTKISSEIQLKDQNLTYFLSIFVCYFQILKLLI